MKEALLAGYTALVPERPRENRIHYTEIQHKISDFQKVVAKHEYTHAFAIWGVGESTHGGTVEPTSQYAGATFHSGEMSPAKKQIAAMASIDQDGNGSDQMNAYVLQFMGGIPMEQAASIARSIVASYRTEVVEIAATYFAFYRKATDEQLRMFLLWAEEDLKAEAEWKDVPVSSFYEEFEQKRNEKEADKQASNDHHNSNEKTIFEREYVGLTADPSTFSPN